jgi:uncharacterized protein (TIGR00730 family)
MEIGIFCSSRESAAILFGGIVAPLLSFLYECGCKKIIYGGGDKGLMGVVYRESVALGMKVHGHNLERWSQRFENEIVYTSLLERQNGLIQESQMYIVLPGGIGTIYELSQVLCHNDVEQVGKKVILYNYDHYFDGFIAMLQHSISLGLMDNDRLHFYIITSLDELKEILI